MRFLAKTIYKLSNILSVIAVILIMLLNAPKLLKIYPYSVLSGSMEPTIATNSLIYVKQTPQTYHVGDIVSYEIGDQIITHRIVEQKEEGSFVLKGDANSKLDPYLVNSDMIKGKMIFSIPAIGKYLGGISQRTWLVIAIWVTAINIIGISAKQNYDI